MNCEGLDLNRLPEEDRFQTNSQRVKHRHELYEILSKSIADWKAEALLQALHGQQVPTGEIKDLEQVFEIEQARRMLVEEEHQGRKTIRPKTTVFRMHSQNL